MLHLILPEVSLRALFSLTHLQGQLGANAIIFYIYQEHLLFKNNCMVTPLVDDKILLQ